jgi:hypothetical protein
MHASKIQVFGLLIVCMLVLPWTSMPSVAAWTAGDEAAVFGHTFTEEYWTNSSLVVNTTAADATLTASYVHVGDFSAFLIAFN